MVDAIDLTYSSDDEPHLPTPRVAAVYQTLPFRRVLNPAKRPIAVQPTIAKRSRRDTPFPDRRVWEDLTRSSEEESQASDTSLSSNASCSITQASLVSQSTVATTKGLLAPEPSATRRRRRSGTPCPGDLPGFRFLHTARLQPELDKGTCYREGALLSVQVYGQQRPGTVSLHEVLQVERLSDAVLSSQVWDESWLLGAIGLAQVTSTWVMDPRQNASSECITKLAGRATHHRTLHFPPKPFNHCSNHGKLMLLFRTDGFLRIAIPTGNLQRTDWGAAPPLCGQRLPTSHGTLDNTVWLIDLPLLTGDDDPKLQSSIAFRSELLEYLDLLQLNPTTGARVCAYNFDLCKHYGFVYTG